MVISATLRGAFKGWPDILVIEMPSVFAFNLKFVCFSFVYLSFRFCKKKKKIVKMMEKYNYFTDKFNINAYN